MTCWYIALVKINLLDQHNSSVKRVAYLLFSVDVLVWRELWMCRFEMIESQLQKKMLQWHLHILPNLEHSKIHCFTADVSWSFLTVKKQRITIVWPTPTPPFPMNEGADWPISPKPHNDSELCLYDVPFQRYTVLTIQKMFTSQIDFWSISPELNCLAAQNQDPLGGFRGLWTHFAPCLHGLQFRRYQMLTLWKCSQTDFWPIKKRGNGCNDLKPIVGIS